MKILYVGDWPAYNGGVCNYTRPIHEKMAKNGNQVHYLFSGGGYHQHYNYLALPYLKTSKINSNIYWHEIINSPNKIFNYDNPRLDWSNNKVATIAENLIRSIKPDVIHINEMIGFSSFIIPIAKKLNVKIIVTVHEYWWLCIHRVMVDYNNQICDGPTDMSKCAFCIEKKVLHSQNGFEQRLIKVLRYCNPKIIEILQKIRKIFVKKREQYITDLEIKNLDYKSYYKKNSQYENMLKERLKMNIQHLNMSDAIIAVSSEVKQILMKYGVNRDIIIVQHIGSSIAERKIAIEFKKRETVTFGFIGGVGYYKGVHLLVEAFMDMSQEFKSKSMVKIFGKQDSGYYNAMLEKYSNMDGFNEKIKFYGGFNSKDLPDLLSQIDFMVLPSICNDTAPQTIFETYSAKIPIIAPRIGGFPDFITDKINGLLFSVGNVNDLRNQLEYAITNYDKIDQYRENIPALKTLDKNVEELLRIYSQY